MSSLTQIQQDIATLPPEAQKIIFDLVALLKKRSQVSENRQSDDWSDFIACGEAEADLSRNHKTYLEAYLWKNTEPFQNLLTT